jgi:hypothetical protein
MKAPQVSSFCLKNSQVKIYQGRCQECGKDVFSIAQNKKELQKQIRSSKNHFVDNEITCSNCWNKKFANVQGEENSLITSFQEIESKSKKSNMYQAIEKRKWNQLRNDELDILKHVVKSESKWDAYKRVFPDGNPQGQNSGLVWRILNKLDEMDLIWLKRVKGSKRIAEIITLPGLKEHLFETLNDERSYEQENNDHDHLERVFAFVMEKNLFSMNARHPDYSGIFRLTRDIVLRKDTKYRYGGWINDDGSLYIKITPYAQPFTDTRPVEVNDEDIHHDDQPESGPQENSDFDDEAPF